MVDGRSKERTRNVKLKLEEMSIENYKSIIKYNPDALFILSVEGTIIEVNQMMAEMLGFTKEELQGKNYKEILVPECQEFTSLKYQEVLQGKSPEYETQLFHKDGEKVYLQVKNIPLWDNGEIVGIFGIAKNITELNKTKETLAEMEERIKALFYSVEDAIYILDLEGNVIDVNPAFEELYGWKREELIGKLLPIIPKYRYEQHENMLAQAKKGSPIKIKETICMKKDGTPIEVSLALSPLLDKNGKVLGMTGVTRDILERNQLEKSLKESEERYRKVVEYSPQGIVIHRNNIILYANSAALKIVNEKNIIGKSILDYIHPHYHELSKERLSRMTKEEKEFPFEEFQLVLKSGKIVDVEVNSTTIQLDGEMAVLTIIKDITERKRLERDLNESLKKLADVNFALDESSVLAITNKEGIIEYVNDKFCDISKYSRDELIGQNHRILNSGYHSKEFFQKMWQTIGKGKTWRGEIRNKAKDGTFYWADTTIVPFLNEEGKPYQYISIRTDITERKQAEEALRQSEERYRLIAENMTDFICIINKEGIFTYASPSHEAILEFSYESYKGTHLRDWLHKDEIAPVQNLLTHILKTKKSDSIEFRLSDVKGNWIWFESEVTPFFDEDGQFKHFLFTSREIMERKAFEEKLTHLAFHDTLTQIPNRRLFMDRLNQAIKEAERYERKMAVMFMDMDRFKKINDNLGHDVGDELLKQFAQRVAKCIRESDTLARLGGDEFTVLLPEIQEEQNAIHIAKRILSSLQEPWIIGKHIFHTTSSIGIAFYPADGINTRDLLKHADKALYMAKEDGRNNFKTYSKL